MTWCRVTALGLFAFGLGCSGASEPVDAGSDAPSALAPEAAASLETASFALSIATALSAPLVPQAEGLRDDGGRLDGPGREARTRSDVEAGVSGMSVVTPESCASYVWSGLSVMATFAGCTLESTGESIDGDLAIAVQFFPSRIALTFTDLTVGATSVTGMLSLNVGGACGGADLGCMPCRDTDAECMAAAETQSTLTGSLTVTSSGTTVLDVADVTVTSDTTGITASGELSIDGAAITADALHWAAGSCLPSSGTATLTSSMTTITFLSTTPADGIVEVRIGALPPFSQALFTPCET